MQRFLPPTGVVIEALDNLLNQARGHYSRQQLQEAEAGFRSVLEQQPSHEEALQSLVVIALQTGRRDEARSWLERLVQAYPEQALYHERLATLLESGGDHEGALAVYRKLVESQPQHNDSRFKYARLLKRYGYLEEALEHCREGLQRGIDKPEDVFVEMGTVLGDLNRLDDAEYAYRAALRVHELYTPALYNLGLLQEERGNWAEAKVTFSGILDTDTSHVDAMARLAHGETQSDLGSPLVRKMGRTLKRPGTTPDDQETLHYALAKTLDDLGEYDAAFEHLDEANRLSRERCQPYNVDEQRALTDRLIEFCNTDWMAGITPVSEAPLVFVCGMFRSGSTLLEQILGNHPALVSGGEISFLPREIGRLPGSYPDSLAAAGVDLAELGRGYLEELGRLYGESSRVIDKRPDNFLYLGLVRALFPNAKILNTQRDPLDTGLSLYSQALAGKLGYANRLEDIAHYWREYQRLMDHWRALLGDNLLDVPYESLVGDLQGTASGALAFLGLDWHPDCAEFHKRSDRVRTASVSQVRRELYTASIGRWKNYESQLAPLRQALEP